MPPEELLRTYAGAIRACPHNLLSPRGLSELDSRHIPECVAFAEGLPNDGPLIDVGTGAGLPGMVIALVRPDLEVHLLDATRKKTVFLSDTAQLLRVPVTVHTGRAEELGRTELRGRFRIVTARAVAPLARLVTLTAPLLQSGGTLHAIKGESWEGELDDARTAIERAGCEVVAVPSSTEDRGVSPAPRVVKLRRRA